MDVESKIVGVRNVKNKIDMELDAQDAEFERVYECPEGCGRTFKRAALEKHVKVCKKIFQVKNDDVAGYQEEAASKPGKGQVRGGSVQPQKSTTSEPQIIKKPVDKQKWKQDRENLKQLIKKGNTVGQTEDVVMVKEKNGVMVEKIPDVKLCPKCEEGFATDQLLKDHTAKCKGKAKVIASKPTKPIPAQSFDDDF